MRRTGSGIVTALVLIIVLWMIWSRLHIVIWVAVPWWGLLIMAVVLFLLVDYVVSQVLRRRP